MNSRTGSGNEQDGPKTGEYRRMICRDRWILTFLTLSCAALGTSRSAVAAETELSRQAALTTYAKTDLPRVIGEVRDPCLKIRWQVIADGSHPERPGRLVAVLNAKEEGSPRQGLAIPVQTPVIQWGASITVFQATRTVTAQLQAVAMESAVLGRSFRARLVSQSVAGESPRIAVISVVATGPKTATWGDQMSVRP